ncbi:MAG: RNA helicase, partial [Pseudogulbenkiania sp.]|nr:RNA helicase [Pseudogulbenkiania sp.]
MTDTLITIADTTALEDYLALHRAKLVTTEGSYALSVHGEIAVGQQRVPYHLVPDEGFLGKTAKWRKLDAAARLALVQER